MPSWVGKATTSTGANGISRTISLIWLLCLRWWRISSSRTHHLCTRNAIIGWWSTPGMSTPRWRRQERWLISGFLIFGTLSRRVHFERGATVRIDSTLETTYDRVGAYWLAGMNGLRMLTQIVQARKCPIAMASKRTLTSVLANVPCQMLRAGKDHTTLSKARALKDLWLALLLTDPASGSRVAEGVHNFVNV